MPTYYIHFHFHHPFFQPLLPANSSSEMIVNDGMDGGEEAAFLHGGGPFYEYPAFYPAPPFGFPMWIF
jgi:hypothetical protein